MRSPAGIQPERYRRSADGAVCLAVWLYFVGFVVYAIASQRGLVGDGAGFFIDIAANDHVATPLLSRWTSNALTQWPVLAALNLRVTDLSLLSRIHSFGLYYLALIVLPVSWLLLPRQARGLLALPALTLVFGWMGACYSTITEGQVAVLWFWPTAFALRFLDFRSVAQASIVLLLALPIPLMHESISFLGPILAMLAYRRSASEARPSVRWTWRLVALWILAGAVLELYFTVFPPLPVSREGFIHGILRFHYLYWGPDKFNPPVAVALVAAALMLTCCRWERASRRLLPLWMTGYALLLLTAGLAPLLLPRLFTPELQIDARSWLVATPLVLACCYAAMRAGLFRIPRTARPLLVAIGAMAALSQITWQIGATVQWNASLTQMRRQLAAAKGYLPYEDSLGRRQSDGPVAREVLAPSGWTFPQLSIALAPGGKVATIIGNPQPIWWQAFDPKSPAALPRIAGVDYTDYLAALSPAPQ